MVRLEGIEEIAGKFVRVRLAEIESSDLRLFEFDYDLTFMVFFLSPDEKVYARYGGRCDKGPDERQSLAGLRYTMESVMAEHASKTKRFAPTTQGRPFHIRDVAPPRGLGRCIHCHQAKEVIYNELDMQGKWNFDLAFRYPPPDNLGLKLEVDRGNVVKEVNVDSPTEKAGLQKHDLITILNNVPIHSFGDAQFALDRAPSKGAINVAWRRGEEEMRGRIDLPDRWRRTDISWRASLYNFVATPKVYGKDLSAQEKAKLGLSEKQLAFRQQENVPESAAKAGVRAGDIIVGLDDKELELTAYKFLLYVRSNYIKGETITLNVIRNGQRLRLLMRLE